jgi:hypothetical protein
MVPKMRADLVKTNVLSEASVDWGAGGASINAGTPRGFYATKLARSAL